MSNEELYRLSMPDRETPDICRRFLQGDLAVDHEQPYVPAYPKCKEFGVCQQGSFQVGERLGEGSYGIVVRGVHRRSGTRVALKYFNMRHPWNTRGILPYQVYREECMGNRISLPTVRKHYCSYYNEHTSQAVLVMELIEGWELKVAMQARTDRALMPEIAAQMAVTLKAFHLHGLVYSDFKWENVMLSTENKVKLIDCGLVQMIDGKPTGSKSEPMGSALFWPPEFFPLHDTKCYKVAAADWWAYGLTMYCAISGSTVPYDMKSMDHLTFKEKLIIFGKLIQHGPVVSPSMAAEHPAFAHLFSQLTLLNPSERLGSRSDETALQDILAHAWFSSVPDLGPFFRSHLT